MYYVFPSLYLRREAVGALRAEDVSPIAGEAALSVEGVAGYWGADRPLHPLLARGIFPERSGDLLLAYQPYYWERYGEGRGVSPGSFYSYDTRVPLVFYGGQRHDPALDRVVALKNLIAGKRVLTPRTAPEMKTIRHLIVAAAGILEQRGDLLTVENLPFEGPEVPVLGPPAPVVLPLSWFEGLWVIFKKGGRSTDMW